MPEVVLRNPSLSGQPVVVPVAADGVVPFEYKAAGFEIDSATSADDARAENAATSAAAVAGSVSVAASFAPNPSAELAPRPAPTPPAPVPSPIAPTAVSDPMKEN